MALSLEIVCPLQEIVGKENVLTDVEDLYVYSFRQIYKKRLFSEIKAVVRTEKPKEIERVKLLAREQNYLLVKRGEIPEGVIGKGKPIIFLDDTKQSDLQTSVMVSEISSQELEEFRKSENIDLKKLALAQKLTFQPIIAKCEECTICSSYCTVASSFNGVETWSAKGRMLLMRGITDQDLAPTPKIAEIIYTCSSCGLCFAECLQQSELKEAILEYRKKLAITEFVPEAYKTVANNIIEVGDPAGTPPEKRFSWLSTCSIPLHRDEPKILYWVGCTTGTRTPNTPRAVVNLITRAGIDLTLLNNEEGCCGYILLASGLLDEAKANALRVVERVDETQIETIVTSCAGCYYTFSKLFPEILGVEMPCEVLHASEFIEKTIVDRNLRLKPIDSRITYHDPCALGRHAGIYDPPRSLLKRLPKLQFEEMPLTRSRARCCGGGGGLWSYNNKVSMNSALNRLMKDVVPLNIDILATSCPTCQMNLKYAAARNSVSIKVCDVAEIAEVALTNDAPL